MKLWQKSKSFGIASFKSVLHPAVTENDICSLKSIKKNHNYSGSEKVQNIDTEWIQYLFFYINICVSTIVHSIKCCILRKHMTNILHTANGQTCLQLVDVE